MLHGAVRKVARSPHSMFFSGLQRYVRIDSCAIPATIIALLVAMMNLLRKISYKVSHFYDSYILNLCELKIFGLLFWSYREKLFFQFPDSLECP